MDGKFNIEEIKNALTEVMTERQEKDNDILIKLREKFEENVLSNVNKYTDYCETTEFINRILYIGGVEDVSADLNQYIRIFNDYDDRKNIPVEQRVPIKIIINSPGGYLSEAYSIIDSIKLSKTPVWTINMESAYSAAFLIFICGHKRICYPHSSFLFHEGHVNLGTLDVGKFQNYTSFHKQELDIMKKIVLENTNITEEYYDEHRKDDVWYLADEAIELGIADEIATKLI